MIAYKQQWLDNIAIGEQLEKSFADGDITTNEKENAVKQYPVGFYTPNIFIKVGLFVLTIVIVSFSFGLFALLGIGSSEKSIGGISLFVGIASFVILEVMVKSNFHYRSGVDDALLITGTVCAISAVNIFSNVPSLVNAILIFVFALYGAIRFTDRLMALTAVIALLAMAFYLLEPLGNIARALLPFVLMLVSALVYFSVSVMRKLYTLRHYAGCFTIATIAALCGFYISGNYFMVKQASESLLGAAPANSIPYAWLFWFFTACTPLLYIGWGIVKKDIILMRTGLLLIAFTVFTVRYYYSVMPAELAMIIAGILLLAVSYMLQRWLKQPRAGFTIMPEKRTKEQGLENIEALLVAETLGHPQEPSVNKFGGGSFGGGGASGDF